MLVQQISLPVLHILPDHMCQLAHLRVAFGHTPNMHSILEWTLLCAVTFATPPADDFKMDGRRWKVDWASRADFDLFGWRWTEGRSPSPRR
jgi:hypothetical protein